MSERRLVELSEELVNRLRVIEEVESPEIGQREIDAVAAIRAAWDGGLTESEVYWTWYGLPRNDATLDIHTKLRAFTVRDKEPLEK